jgi:hypothetical protein
MKTWEMVEVLMNNPNFKAKRIESNFGDTGDLCADFLRTAALQKYIPVF